MRRHHASCAFRSLRFRALVSGALALGGAWVASAQTLGPPPPGEPVLTAVQIANLPLGVVTFPNGKAMNLTLALGSAAFRHPADAPGRIWTLTDRGPSIPCAEAKKLIGIEPEAACPGAKDGRIYPLPGFVPSIYGVDIGADHVARINLFVPLKGKSGRPVSGRPTPMSSGPKAEVIFTADGKPLPPDPSGIDPEGLVRLSDGSFWIAEEFGPSLLEVGPDGTIRRRLVPAQAVADFKDADYDIVPALPPVLRQRKPNQGFESLAVSPDEQFLYTLAQSPLAQPDEASTRQARAMRLFKIERASGQVVGEYLYALDPAYRFAGDFDARERAQGEVKITEIAAIGPDKLLVMEQIEKSTRLFMVELDEKHRIPPDFDSLEMTPSLEALDETGLALRALTPMPKTLVLDSDRVTGLPSRIEGFAILSPNEIVFINDNDFAIDGVRTQMFRITLPSAMLKPEGEGKGAPAGPPMPTKEAGSREAGAKEGGQARHGKERDR